MKKRNKGFFSNFDTKKQNLFTKFIMPPFSVLHTYDQKWLSRRSSWINLGLKGEIGRSSSLKTANNSINSVYRRNSNKGNTESKTGISIFDPVLCELMYSWFCPKNGQIIDPFAGGSVRGIIAYFLNLKYWGCELRPEQVLANYQQSDSIIGTNRYIKVSKAMLTQEFHPCSPKFIEKVCKGSCCQGSKGVFVSIHPSEREKIKNKGADIDEKNFIIPDDRGLCPFKTNEGFCSIHEDKPFGCKVSPFTLNENDTLIVRNRYRLLKCYKTNKNKVPVYEAHRSSLEHIFGKQESDEIIKKIEKGQENIWAKIPESSYTILVDNDFYKRKQHKKKHFHNKLSWICGDSKIELDNAPKADFLFTCPPYGNLEIYSKLEEDISNMGYSDFINNYKEIIVKSIEKLKENRFACFVVGNFRDKSGFLNDLVGDTVRIFKENGVYLYNDIVLATSLGSLPVRAGKIFESSKKVGRAHQNVLVFYKGDPKNIKNLNLVKGGTHDSQQKEANPRSRKRKKRTRNKGSY